VAVRQNSRRVGVLARARRVAVGCGLVLALLGAPGGGLPAQAASAYRPPRTGLEPPGGLKKSEVLPGGRSIGRTPEGGMGYTDAYGNTIRNRPPEEKPARPRLRPGAYGAEAPARPERPLPDPQNQAPAWNFR